MTSVCRDLLRAIYEGKWISIEYRNRKDQITKYWIGICDLDPFQKTLTVEGLHLGTHQLEKFEKIYIDSIVASYILDDTYYPVNERLVEDIELNQEKYRGLFDCAPNLKILNYLEDCNKMDATPYKLDFSLIKNLDRESFYKENYDLNEDQFRKIIAYFQKGTELEKIQKEKMRIQKLAMNVLSVHTPKGLYVLAYRKLNLDVKYRRLKQEDYITVSTEFSIDGTKESIRRFLDGDDYELLNDFEKNQEEIKDKLTKSIRYNQMVDDLPYIIGLGIDIPLDLHKEYGGILTMYQNGNVSDPIKAFFGDLLELPRRRRALPIALPDKRVNMDQLLAIHNGMKYPVSYVQGPPGTGKTNTIVNTIITAFFNERTVLFVSYNNHPIDGVAEKLAEMTYKGKKILFPAIRLGNKEKIKSALRRMRYLYEQASQIKVYTSTLEKNKEVQALRAKRLSQILRKYEDLLDLREREETINRLLDFEKKHATSLQMVSFQANLSGRQLTQVERRIQNLGKVSEQEAIELATSDTEELRKYLYYISAKHLQRINEPRYEELKRILYLEDEDAQVEKFQAYLKDEDRLMDFLRIFPVIETTCISAGKLGKPVPKFDMVIMDEASQCNIAIALVPIVRGHQMMLVGDPQQLNPVILLSDALNQFLKKKYKIPEEYNYRINSIYKTFLTCDCVSDEVLLRRHYRCGKKIIEFNNRKYYNSKLLICSESKEKIPLQYIDVSGEYCFYKNTSPAEIEEIIRFASFNRDKTMGVVTPFVNQKNAIEQRLKEEGLSHVSCGTVHAFQGDEKDIILFSTAITDRTYDGTYQWLKNNRELINVAVSRAKEKFVLLSSIKNVERLHRDGDGDDLYELIQYVRSNGTTTITPKHTSSRALGIKPFSTKTEEAFLTTLNHALDNLWLTQNRFSVEKEVAVSQVFENTSRYNELFYSGRFDFVVYENHGDQKFPVLVIELDGKEHHENETVKNRDRKKQDICREHNMQLIRIDNTYARRYQHVKEILISYFTAQRR